MRCLWLHLFGGIFNLKIDLIQINLNMKTFSGISFHSSFYFIECFEVTYWAINNFLLISDVIYTSLNKKENSHDPQNII